MAKVNLLNEVTVRNLKPESGRSRTEYAGKTNPGLVLDVLVSGRKRWYYKYRTGGQRRYIPLGDYPDTDISASVAAYERWRSIDGDPWTEYQRERQADMLKPTVEQLADRYIQTYAKVYKRSWKRDQELLDRNVLGRVKGYPPGIAQMIAENVTRQDLMRLLGYITDRGKWTEARKVARVLSKLFNWSIEKGILSASPAYRLPTKSPRPVQIERQERAARQITDAELKVIWHALREQTGSWAGVLAFMLLTGQRGGEVCAMEWKHVEGDAWTIPETKNGRPHTVPLPDAAISFLADLKRNRRYVFPATKGQLHTDQVARKLGGLLADADIPHFTPHKLRGVVATGMERLGVPHKHIEAVLNHTPQGVTSTHYAKHDYFEEKRQALTRWCAELERIVASKKSDNVVSIR